jgi:hypothetical protein
MCISNKTLADYEAFDAKYDYDPETGKFTFRTGRKHLIGKEAGRYDSDGYIQLQCVVGGDRRYMYAHQLAYYKMTNEVIRHPSVINHKVTGREGKSDNRGSNLEKVSHRENTNQKHLASASQFVGVHWHSQNKYWMVAITIKGKREHLGCFTNEFVAANAYQNALNKLNVEN